MPDREKVIELFSSCISKGGWNNCTNCEHGKAQAVLTCKPLAEDVLKVLKEQEAEIRQLRLALDIAKGTCKGIVVEGR